MMNAASGQHHSITGMKPIGTETSRDACASLYTHGGFPFPPANDDRGATPPPACGRRACGFTGAFGQRSISISGRRGPFVCGTRHAAPGRRTLVEPQGRGNFPGHLRRLGNRPRCPLAAAARHGHARAIAHVADLEGQEIDALGRPRCGSCMSALVCSWIADGQSASGWSLDHFRPVGNPRAGIPLGPTIGSRGAMRSDGP